MKALLIALWNNTGTHHLPERASAAAYYLLFAGLPFVVALLDVLTLLHLDDQLRTLQLVIEETFPPDISTLFLAELSRVVEARSAPRALLAFGLAVYSGEKAVNSLIQGVNAAYATPTPRNMLLDRLMAAIMTGLGLLVSLFVVFLLAGGAWAFTMMAERGLISMGTLSTLTVLRMPVVLLTLHLLVNVLYRVAADTPLPWRWASWGSVIATLGFVAVTEGFQLYVTRVTDLGATYGSLGAAIGLLLFLQLTASSVLFGAEIDAYLLKRSGGKTTRPTPRWKRRLLSAPPPETPPATTDKG
ncbi:MAG: YihY/virulence factor BrkB family protein [Deltaproteobacteria bacterium]|jgi:membrane protein|nr:YihY/virulence factor BrkB family protein [Deltaproteobacteria bacterium]